MDGQDYLNQISVDNRPLKKPKNSFFQSKFFLFIGISLLLLVVIIIFGAVLSGTKGGEKDLSYKLKLHIDNTSSVIQGYQSLVKSSKLRSSSASLQTILSNTSRDLTNYLTEKYNFKDKDISANIVEEATLNKDELGADLFEAKINGILDRIYAHKMTYEVSSIMNEEAKLINSTGNDSLKSLLTDSYTSLERLYEDFNSYSETN